MVFIVNIKFKKHRNITVVRRDMLIYTFVSHLRKTFWKLIRLKTNALMGA